MIGTIGESLNSLLQVRAAAKGVRWTEAGGHTVVEPVVSPAALTTIVAACYGADTKFGQLRSRLRLLRCYETLQELAFAGKASLIGAGACT